MATNGLDCIVVGQWLPFDDGTESGNSLLLNQLDRTGWPDALTSQANVDTASRAEVLMFGKALLASEALDESGLKQRLGVPQVQLKSIQASARRLVGPLAEHLSQRQSGLRRASRFARACAVSPTCVSWRRRLPATSARPMRCGRARAKACMSRC